MFPPTVENIAMAAELLRHNRLVIIPTETVYGLAGLALSEDAVGRIFKAKGRPATNPLIVHVAEPSQVERVALVNHPDFDLLAAHFWPGPLTMVLPKLENVPSITTGGLETVAVRVPSHPVALALLREIGEPLAAPSANLFTGLSPTRPEHLSSEMMFAASMILDGGPCDVGIESTVIDLTQPEVKILRPGIVSTQQLSDLLGKQVGNVVDSPVSPGHHRKHYSPQTPIQIVDKIGVQPGLTFQRPANEAQVEMPADPAGYARELYAALASIDRLGFEEFYVQAPPRTQEWAAIWDRLNKASER